MKPLRTADRRRGGRGGLSPCVLALALAGCGPLGYYGQAITGGARVLLQRRPIESVLRQPDTPAELADRLRLVQRLRAFAREELALPVGAAYSHYVELERSWAVWNVVATPELSVEPLTWCFPVAGCVSYRGYFSEARARRFAGRLRRAGHDVAVEGAAAYSTVGWFADPVLSTFVEYPEPDLAALLFHELAHRAVYVRDDTTFNESFATAVEEEGLRRWVERSGVLAVLEGYRTRRAAESELVRRVLACRDRLAALYASAASEEQKRAGKRRLLGELRSGAGDPELGPYGAWLDRELGNAHLAAIGEYRTLVPFFQALLAEHGGDLEGFYEAVAALAALPAPERTAALEARDARRDEPRERAAVAPLGSPVG